MIGMLSGATVRDRDGTTGRILKWQLPEVQIGWEDSGKLLPREETLDVDNPRLKEQIEVMTLDAGWAPLGNFTSESGAPTPGHSTITQMRRLLDQMEFFEFHELMDRAERLLGRGLFEAAEKLVERAQEILEKTKHWPFKTKDPLGPGPRGGTNKKADKWDCKCSNYSCICTNKEGQKKKVKISKSYKKAYNKEYKKWRREQGF
jgi:hypothetical protein